MHSPADITRVRRWTGSTPDDDTLDVALGAPDATVESVALDILRTRYADLRDSPGRWSADGDWSQEHRADQLRALAADIARLEAITGDGTGLPALSTASITAPRGTR